jgi:hypothetical protein
MTRIVARRCWRDQSRAMPEHLRSYGREKCHLVRPSSRLRILDWSHGNAWNCARDGRGDRGAATLAATHGLVDPQAERPARNRVHPGHTREQSSVGCLTQQVSQLASPSTTRSRRPQGRQRRSCSRARTATSAASARRQRRSPSSLHSPPTTSTCPLMRLPSPKVGHRRAHVPIRAARCVPSTRSVNLTLPVNANPSISTVASGLNCHAPSMSPSVSASNARVEPHPEHGSPVAARKPQAGSGSPASAAQWSSPSPSSKPASASDLRLEVA